ncbi:MAG TPA: phosphate signaling complex protein PhoU [Planctomycetota bacterium]|jgi:phosphate transport system protein|nr:phosphate signaling complex protein PhoU [Planctomycetota bacterium]
MTIHRHFEDQLQELKGRLVTMGTAAESMIERAVKSLLERDASRLADIFKTEQEVNGLHIEVDERVINLIALHHPVATDLRMAVMCSKIAGELERIGDQAVNICQNTTELLRYPPLKPLIDIPLMAEIARRMLRESLDAFVRQDAVLAQKVLNTDDEVDAFKNQIFRELLTYMMSDPGTIPRALALILISRNLERVGDHATNVAEEVIYSAQGRDVRHHHEETRRTEEGK